MSDRPERRRMHAATAVGITLIVTGVVVGAGLALVTGRMLSLAMVLVPLLAAAAVCLVIGLRARQPS